MANEAAAEEVGVEGEDDGVVRVVEGGSTAGEEGQHGVGVSGGGHGYRERRSEEEEQENKHEERM